MKGEKVKCNFFNLQECEPDCHHREKHTRGKECSTGCWNKKASCQPCKKQED